MNRAVPDHRANVENRDRLAQRGNAVHGDFTDWKDCRVNGVKKENKEKKASADLRENGGHGGLRGLLDRKGNAENEGRKDLQGHRGLEEKRDLPEHPIRLTGLPIRIPANRHPVRSTCRLPVR
ncbi:hypothetical protein OXB_0377 [Bacillus sp. OxB-1]|nr:hypothetical protein OXB_0377 [Bacillus sp. OxB-1]